jgi:hypothetical protein
VVLWLSTLSGVTGYGDFALTQDKLFGVDVDELHGLLRLDPHLPADWDSAVVDGLHVESIVRALGYQRKGAEFVVRVTGGTVKLASDVTGAKLTAGGRSILFAMPLVEVAVGHGLPLPGARTVQMRVLGQR